MFFSVELINCCINDFDKLFSNETRHKLTKEVMTSYIPALWWFGCRSCGRSKSCLSSIVQYRF